MAKKHIDWSEFFAEQKASGKTIKAFCCEKNICTDTFYRNRRNLKKRFVEIKHPTFTSAQNNRAGMKLSLHGISLELPPGFCETTFKRVVLALREIDDR